MVARSPELTPENEATYESLMSLIENSQGRLAPIIVGCDDGGVRRRVIARYEQEAREGRIRPYRIELEREPSVRSGLAKLRDAEPYLQQGGAAVFTVTGAEVLLRLKLRPEDEQSDLEQFFGYLQWTREGLREFPYPIVLWVTHRILREMSRRAPDFWGWRKAVLRFVDEVETLPQVDWQPTEAISENQTSQTNNNFLPPLEELLGEIRDLEQKSSNTVGLAALYDKLGQVYANRIEHGQAKNLEQERELTIQAFKKSIELYNSQEKKSESLWVWVRLGNFLDNQSYYSKAIEAHQNALDIAQKIGEQGGQAASLTNLGKLYTYIGQDYYAITLHQQSLRITQQIGDRRSEVIALCNLGYTYNILGQYQQAIYYYQMSWAVSQEINDEQLQITCLIGLGNTFNYLKQFSRAIEFHQKSLELARKNLNHREEAHSLNDLGNSYYGLGKYQRAIFFYQQSAKIYRETGNRCDEASSLKNLANVLAKYEPRRWEALQAYEQAREIYAELKLDHEVEECNTAIYNFNRNIATQQPAKTLELPKQSARDRKRSKLTWKHYLFGAVATVAVIVILVIMVLR